MTNDALFIVIEGLDGSGKTSVTTELKKRLNDKSPDCVKLTYEPHNPSCAGEFIRDVLEKRITQFDSRVLALAYAANRLDHGSRVISPWLEKGKNRIIICDRYYLSSLVYQSDEHFSFEQVMSLNEKARKPDIIFFLNVDSNVCYQRLKIRNQPAEIFDKNLEEFRNKYLSAIKFLQKERQEKVVEINGNQTVMQVVADILKVLAEGGGQRAED